jgi:hypothetical protein
MALMISGHPRSGTTLLQQLCDGHPELGVTNELGNFTHLDQSYLAYARHLFERWRRVQGGWAFDVAYADQHESLRANNLRFILRHLGYLLRRGPGRVTVRRIEAAYRISFSQARILGDKWPHYLFILDRFVDNPDLMHLVIYRDCRDVTSSFLKQVRTTWREADWVGKIDTAEKIAQRWVRGIDMMERYADKVYIIRYETLMQQPRTELNRLADRLAIDPAGFDSEMIRTTSIGKYQTGLTETELKTVMAIAGSTLACLEYV